MSGFVTKRLQDTTFVPTRLLKMEDIGPDSKWQYEVLLPDWLSEKDIWAVWEKERFLSMEHNLNKGDVLFDIGAECGVMSAVLAQFVGGENMVLFEPCPVWWSGIKAIWDKNNLSTPKYTFLGFVGDETSGIDDVVEAQIRDGWPEIAFTDDLAVTTSYRYLHEPQHKAVAQCITIDDFYKLKGFYPDAITIDVEGAELLVIQGAKEVLAKFHPKAWVSVHPDLGSKNYGLNVEELHGFMRNLGYTGELLAVDHEEHWYYHA